MANEALKNMIFKQMFEQQAADEERERLIERGRRLAEMTPGLMGGRAKPEETTPYLMGEEEMFPGEQEITGEAPFPGYLMDITQEAAPATGYYVGAGQKAAQELDFNKAMLESGVPEYQKEARKNLSAYGAAMTASEDPLKVAAQASRDVEAELKQKQIDLGWAKHLKKMPDEAKILKTEEEARKTTNITQHNAVMMESYGNLKDSSEKFQPALGMTNRIIDLAKGVETGPVAGLAPLVWIRKTLGDEKLQELEAALKGMPLPILKKIFGAQFTQKEGETLAESFANLKMDSVTFMNKMETYKNDLQYSEDEFQAQTSYLEENGNLVGYTSEVVRTPESFVELDEFKKKGGETKTINGVDYFQKNGKWYQK